MENETSNINESNPKLAVVRTKNQIDFFMHDYAVYKKNGVVVMDVMTPADNNEDFHSYYELTAEEFEADNYRVIADNIRANRQQYADRELR